MDIFIFRILVHVQIGTKNEYILRTAILPKRKTLRKTRESPNILAFDCKW